MKQLKYLIIIIVSLLVLSFLFYGITLPAKNFLGCYVNSNNTNKICINSDNTFDQLIYKNNTWENFNSSNWSVVMMKDVAGEFAILTIESSKSINNKILQNVTLQPYKDLLGRVKISVGIDSEPYEDGEIYKKL